jgi:flagella basal body P-ring formation protein FlgA
MPGTRRTLNTQDLQRFGKLHGIQPDLWPAVCFEVPMSAVSAEAALESMTGALGLPGSRITIRRIEPDSAPTGQVVFPRSGLTVPSLRGTSRGENLVWHGYVLHSGNHRYRISAFVDLRVTTTRVVAARDLTAGSLLDPSDVKTEEHHGSIPELPAAAKAVEQTAGRVIRRSVRAGQPILLPDLSEAQAVRRGDRVEVEVRNGAARLKLVALAMGHGRTGDWIQVKNIDSGKQFGAKVQAAGKVVVLTGGGDR